MDKLLIIDGNSIANRAFYALPYLSNSKGVASGAVYGFVNILLKIIQTEMPTHVAVAFDHTRKTFRNEIYADYKGNRKPTPPDLVSQFPLIKNMLKAMKIQTFEFASIEADDIIGTIVNRCSCQKIILSGDRDLLQLIDNTTSVCLTKKGVTEVAVMDKNSLKTELGLTPAQIIELKGLMGDASDNIPGVKGIGEKTALSLLAQYGSIDSVYANIGQISGKLKEKLEEGKEFAFLSKKLATIKTDCDFEFDFDKCKLNFPLDKDAVDFFAEMEFSSLFKNKALFKSDMQSVEKIEIEKVKIDVLDDVKNLALKAKDFFAYDLKNLTFAVDNQKEYYLNVNYDMFGSSLSIEQVLLELKKIFESNTIIKITQHTKSDLTMLQKLDIQLNNYFDIEIARYVTTAGTKMAEKNISVCQYKQEMETLTQTMQQQGTLEIYKNIEMPLAPILQQMEQNGFKINESKLQQLKELFEEKLEKAKRDIYVDAGEEFNINSPKQVAYILFDKLGIKAYNNKKGSTSIDVLDELRFIPIVENILQYRKTSKILNTYIDVYQNICKNSGNVIHTTFNQTLTSTGRLSSSEPNLQTIPTRDEEGRELRKIFISKFDGGSLISADYNQIELRLLAHMSDESQLIKAYNEGVDIHTLTASQIFEVATTKVTQNMRREAKAVNFGIIYGISDYGLSQNIKSSRSRAKEYIDSYFSRYPKVKEFMDNNVKYAKEHGQISTMFGRIRKIPEISSSKYQVRTFGERVAMNMPLQGSASDIIKLAMLRVANALKKVKLKSQLILQIHDELIIDVFPGEERIAADILKQEMENVVKLKVPLIVSVGIGKNLYDCK